MRYQWTAQFNDGKSMNEDENSFGEVIDNSKSLDLFNLHEMALGGSVTSVNVKDGYFVINGIKVSLESSSKLTERKLIYFRRNSMDLISGERSEPEYHFGYEGKNKDNKVEKKVIILNGK